MTITWPTVLTLSRIVLIPFIVTCIVQAQWMAALGLFIVAALTDVGDGALARYMHQETEYGVYLDPLADKLLVVSCYVALLYRYGPRVGVPSWLIPMVIMRETVLIGGALLLYVYALRNNSLVPVSIRPTLVGKLTMVAHCIMLSIIYMMRSGLWRFDLYSLNVFAIIIAVLMVISGIQYGIAWGERAGSV